MRLTRRGRLVRTFLVAGSLVLGTIVVLERRGEVTIPGLGPPCAITVSGQQQRVSRDEAVRAASIAARVSARGATAGSRRVAVPGAPSPVEQRLADRLGTARSLTCRTESLVSDAGLAAEKEGRNGLTPRADRVRREIRGLFGSVPFGGFAPGGVEGGHIEGSAHYDGRALDVFFRPVSAESTRDGWVLASWLVASAERLQIATVIFSDSIWSARRSGEGWRDYQAPGGGDSAVLRHLDHVHVDVLEGSGASA